MSATDAATGAGLSLSSVSVGYGRRRNPPVVRNANFELAAGEWLAVIGPNGAGKSTLLKGIAGVLPVSGMVSIGDRSGQPVGDRERSRLVAFVPQQPLLPPGMTAAEYVLLGRSAHLNWFASESPADRLRAEAVIADLDLEPLAERDVTELSGGEAQRVALGRALAQDAPVLVLDEPTSALDLAHQVAALELVDELRKRHGLTVISAMHDLTMVSRFANRILLLAEGSQAAFGTPGEVLTAERLSTYFATPVAVSQGPDGGVVVVPLRTS